MRRSWRRIWTERLRYLPYVVALGLLAGGLLLVEPGAARMVMILPALAVIGARFGTVPAILAGLVGGAAFALPPPAPQPLMVLLFAAAAACIVWATDSQRREVERARESEARLAEIFRQIPGAAAIIEAPAGKLLLRSARSDAILGQREREVPSLQELGHYGGLHADGRPYTGEDYPISRALQCGEIVEAEPLRYRRPDGMVVDLEVYAGPVRGKDGRIVAAIGTAFDVTTRRTAERQLRDSEQRHLALSQRLEEALQRRELLLREADHRIKNSLQLVISLLSLQMMKLTDADARQALDSAIARVKAVADAHLALQESPDLRIVAIPAMVADLCLRLGTLNPAIRLSCATPDELWLNAEQAIPLGLILSEVVTNALRHAFPGHAGGNISVVVEVQDAALIASIADDGIGMSASSARPAVGQGLGTSIIRSLARQIGAVVSTQSAAGRGTTVILSLKLSEVPAEPPAMEARALVGD